MRSWTAWKSSDASVTTKFYRDLDARGPIGMLAHALFKANKSSYRAKRYRGGNGQKSFKDLAYKRKRSSLYELSQILTKHAEPLESAGDGRRRRQSAKTIVGSYSWQSPKGKSRFIRQCVTLVRDLLTMGWKARIDGTHTGIYRVRAGDGD